ncbi:uncharacterized protein LOC135931198 [Gordionus sp. m RMFG-2023]|uniref:uncharacterized protein LOC135931198 n=1 Tax=Gordionus sp. m RMFG-2023 TaxID=3053472 RepID=UPI0031FC3672
MIDIIAFIINYNPNTLNKPLIQKLVEIEKEKLEESKMAIKMSIPLIHHILFPLLIAINKSSKYVSIFSSNALLPQQSNGLSNIEIKCIDLLTAISYYPNWESYPIIFTLWKEITCKLSICEGKLDKLTLPKITLLNSNIENSDAINYIQKVMLNFVEFILIPLHIEKPAYTFSILAKYQDSITQNINNMINDTTDITKLQQFRLLLWCYFIQQDFHIDLSEKHLNLNIKDYENEDDSIDTNDDNTLKEDVKNDGNKIFQKAKLFPKITSKTNVEEFCQFTNQARQEARFLLIDISRLWPNEILSIIISFCNTKMEGIYKMTSSNLNDYNLNAICISWECLFFVTAIYKKLSEAQFLTLSNEVKDNFLIMYQKLLSIDNVINKFSNDQALACFPIYKIEEYNDLSQTFSYILSCLSNFKSILSFFPPSKTQHYFRLLLEKIFKYLENGDDIKDDLCKPYSYKISRKELIRHSCALLIVLSQNNTINLKPHFDYIKSCIISIFLNDETNLTYTHKFALLESLILLWNENQEFSEEKLKFYQNLLHMPIQFWTSAEFRSGALSSVKNFINFFGLNKDPLTLDIGGGLKSDYPYNKTGYSLLAFATVVNRYEFAECFADPDGKHTKTHKYIFDAFKHLLSPFMQFAQNTLSLFDSSFKITGKNNDYSLHQHYYDMYLLKNNSSDNVLSIFSVLDVPEAEKRNILNNFSSNLSSNGPSYLDKSFNTGHGDIMYKRLLEVNKFFNCNLDRIYRILGGLFQKILHFPSGLSKSFSSDFYSGQLWFSNTEQNTIYFFSGSFFDTPPDFYPTIKSELVNRHIDDPIPTLFQAKCCLINFAKPLFTNCSLSNETRNFNLLNFISTQTGFIKRLSQIYALNWTRRCLVDKELDYCSIIPGDQYFPTLVLNTIDIIGYNSIVEVKNELDYKSLKLIDNESRGIVDDYLLRTYSKEYFEFLLLILIKKRKNVISEVKEIYKNESNEEATIQDLKNDKNKYIPDNWSADVMGDLGKIIMKNQTLINVLIPVIFRTLSAKDKSLSGKAMLLSKAILRELISQKFEDGHGFDANQASYYIDSDRIKSFIMNNILKALFKINNFPPYTLPITIMNQHTDFNTNDADGNLDIDPNFLNLALWAYQILRPLNSELLDSSLISFIYARQKWQDTSVNMIINYENDEYKTVYNSYNERIKVLADKILVDFDIALYPSYMEYLNTLCSSYTSTKNFKYKRDIFKFFLFNDNKNDCEIDDNLIEDIDSDVSRKKLLDKMPQKKHKAADSNRQTKFFSKNAKSTSSIERNKSKSIYKVDNRNKIIKKVETTLSLNIAARLTDSNSQSLNYINANATIVNPLRSNFDNSLSIQPDKNRNMEENNEIGLTNLFDPSSSS